VGDQYQILLLRCGRQRARPVEDHEVRLGRDIQTFGSEGNDAAVVIRYVAIGGPWEVSLRFSRVGAPGRRPRISSVR
jgi:hypothetical protein